MSNQYFDPYGRSGPGRGLPPAPRDPWRGPPSMKSNYPGGVPDPRYRPRPPPQQPPPLSAMESTGPFPNGNAFAAAGAEQWPLPPQPIGQDPSRSNSPVGGSPRAPPQRPPRQGHSSPIIDSPRSHGRMAPGYAPHSRGPPPQRPPRGYGEWNDDYYMAPQQYFADSSAKPRRPPPPRPSQSPVPAWSGSPRAMQYQQMPRPPPGAMPYARRDPQGYYHQPAYVQGPAEDVNRRGAGSRNATHPVDDATLATFTPPYANPVKIPSYYFEQSENSPGGETTPVSAKEFHDSPMEPQRGNAEVDSETEQRDEATPEPPALIRQASLGKKTRPTLTTVKKRGSSEESGTTISSKRQDGLDSREQLTSFPEELENVPGAWISESSTPADETKHTQIVQAGGAGAVAGATIARTVSPELEESKNSVGNQRRSSEILVSPLNVKTVLPREAPSKPAEIPAEMEPVVSPLDEQSQPSRSRSPQAQSPEEDLRNRSAPSPPSPEQLTSPTEGFSERTGKAKPNSLTIDIDAVRDAEVRGSMTSLPDLIRRATRLASNLDRGKTASRLGLNFFDFNGSTDAFEKYRAADGKNRRSGSISDMLSSFPPPGSRDSKANFSSLLRRSKLPSDSDAEEIRAKQKRKCCGLPLWGFVLLLVVLFLLVAAAVIIPVVLLIVPKQNDSSSGTHGASSTTLQRCQQSLTCHNGGLNIIGSDSSCSCLCINGYTGASCTTHSKTGCTTMAAGPAKNATVGENIPQLISNAGPQFSIPLDGETLLGLFSKTGLSCASENALVTFSNANTRSVPPVERALTERDSVGAPRLEDTGTEESPNSKGSIINFARVAVLYVFQETGEVKSAVTAQENFQSYFTSRRTLTGDKINPRNVTLGNGFSCDLIDQSLVWNLSNGTTVAS